MQVKMFFLPYAPAVENALSVLQEPINEWLHKNDNIKVKHIKQNVAGREYDLFALISVWYDEKK